MNSTVTKGSCLTRKEEICMKSNAGFRGKKLAYIVELDNMLKTYDDLDQCADDSVEVFGRSVSELVKVVIAKYANLVKSKHTLTCRNVLIANYETMTNLHYWLNHRLFADLPDGASKALKRDIMQMVNLLNELAMKIFLLEDAYKDVFFDKMMKRLEACQYTKYDVWKTRQINLAIKKFRQFQAELTADMLNLGVMNYDDDPLEDEIQQVRLDLLMNEMTHGKKLCDNFVGEAAKLRRYTYWEGDKFMVNFQLIKKYLFRVFDKLTNEQRIAIYEYNVQMRKLHKDMEDLMEQEPQTNDQLIGERIKKAVNTMKSEKLLEHAYDYTFIMTIMNDTADMPIFDSPNSFLTYLASLGIDGLPGDSSIKKEYGRMTGKFPDWKFIGKDKTESDRRINIGKRFLNLYRKAV